MSDDVQRRAGAFRRRVALVPLLIGPALVAGDSASGNQSLSFGWPDAPISSYGDRLRALPDLNGDGSADFAVNSGQPPGISVMLSGDAAYTQHRLDTERLVETLIVEDVNGDGILDVLLASRFAQSIDVRLGLGGGAFGGPMPMQYSLSFSPGGPSSGPFTERAVVGDIDGDGAREVIALGNFSIAPGEARHLVVIPIDQDGLGSMQASWYGPEWPGGPAEVHKVDLVDGDGDGDTDVLFHDTESWWLIRNNNGVLGIPELFVDLPWIIEIEALCDLDGNGFSDLVTYFHDPVDRGLDALLLFEDGQIEKRRIIDDLSSAPSFGLIRDAGDLDGDGATDLLLVDEGNNRSFVSVMTRVLHGGEVEFALDTGRVLATAGTGTPGSGGGVFVIRSDGDRLDDDGPVAFVFAAEPDAGRPLLGVQSMFTDGGDHVLAADIDADGSEELLVTGGAFVPENSVYGIGPDGRLVDRGTFGYPDAVGRALQGDINGDGADDIIQYGYTRVDFRERGFLAVSLAEPGGFGEPILWDPIQTSTNPGWFAVADMDADGIDEVVVSWQFNSNDRIVRLDPDGVLRSTSVEMPFQGEYVTTFDHDGDGLPDLITHRWREGDTYAARNFGGKQFAEPELMFEDFALLSDVAGDFDGDGFEDIALLSESKNATDPKFDRESEIVVLWGAAPGEPATPTRFLTGQRQLLAIHSFDADGDGRADLVATKQDRGSRLFRQCDIRVYAAAEQYLGFAVSSVCAADLDGSGAPEIAHVRSTQNAVGPGLVVAGRVSLDVCVADLAEPFGVLNFFDLAAFIGLFNVQDPAADLAAPFGIWNFFDVTGYLGLYSAGCP